MKEYRLYFDKRFYKQKDGYWANIMPIHAHRWVWINHHGAIPPKMDIHHKDGDKSNNEIDNLELLSRSDHLKRHWEDPKLRTERRKQLDLIRPLVHEWLRSPEGREKQKIDAIKGWRKRKLYDLVCKECNQNFKSAMLFAKYCSENCYMRNVRKRPESRIVAHCAFCNEMFLKLKYTPIRCCSVSCGTKLGIKEKKEKSQVLLTR